MDNEENPNRFGPKYFPEPGMFGQMEGFGNHFPQQHQLPFGQTALNQRSAVSQQMQNSTFPFSNQRMNLLPSPNFSPQTSVGFNPWSMYYPSPHTSAPPDTAILSGRYPAGDLNNQIRSPSLFQGYYQANTLDDPRIQRQSQMDQTNVFRSGMTRERDMYMEQLREESIKKERENQILREMEIQRQKDRELQLIKKQEEERQKLSEFHHLRQEQPQLNQQATQFFSRSQATELHSNIFSQQNSFGNAIPQSFIKTDPRTTKPTYPPYSQALDSNQKSPLIKTRRPDIFPPVLDSFKDQSERMKYFSSVADNPKNPLSDIFSFNFPEGSNFSSNMKSSVAEIKQSLMKSINSSHLNKTSSQNPKDFSHFDDIDLTVDRHMSPFRFNTSEVNSHKSREDSLLENFPSILGSSDGTGFPNMSKPSHESQNFGMKSQTASNFNIETNLNHASAHTEPQMFSGGAETSNSYYKDEPKVSFSQRSKVQVTQNSAVNINININMPPTPHFPFHLGGISASPKEMKDKTDKAPVQSQGDVQTSSYSVQHPNKATTDTSIEKNEIITKSHSYESCTVSSSTTSSSKTTFGSIESFLGMNDIGNNGISSSLEPEMKTISTKGDGSVESSVSVRQSKNVSQNFKASSKSEQFSKSSVIDEKSEYVVPHFKFASESPITSENLMISEKTLKKVDNRESVPAGFKEVKVSENLPQNSQVLEQSKNQERMSVIIPLATATKEIDMTTNRGEKEKSVSEKEIKSPSHSKKASSCDEVFSPSSAASLVHPSLRMKNEASKRDIASVKDDAILKRKHEAQQHKASREEDMKQDQGNNVKILHPSLRLQKRGRSSDSFSTDIPSEIKTTPITDKEISVAEVDEDQVKESSSNPRNPKLVSNVKSRNSKTLEENDNQSNKGYSESSMSSLIAAIQQDVMRNKNKRNSQDFLDEMEILQNENNTVYQNENESEKSNGENILEKISETEMMDDEMNETNCSGKSENSSFGFRNITFEENCHDTNQDDSSSESEYSDEAEETKDSECGTEDHEEKPQGSGITSNRKRSANHSAELIASLKKRKTIDEDLIKIPLDHGWVRQTRLRICGPKETIRGDVYYYSPCGKKLRTYPEINAYIKKEEIEDVQLEHFSFSTKIKVGDFLESKQGSKFEKLTEDQVQDRFDKMNEKVKELEKKAMERSAMKQKKMEELKRLQEEKERVKEEQQAMKKAKEEERKRLAQKKADDLKLKKQREAEALREAKRQKEESLMLKKLEKKAALEALRIAKEERIQRNLEAKRKQKEQKEKERQEKLEQQRLRKEWRQQMLENEKEKKRQQLNVSKVKEKQKKKHEHVMMKANEARRKAEERERQKEQRRLEKTLEKQKKIEQKRFARMIVKELKKPIDDMALADLRPLPEIPRVKNLCISGKAYANLLMVYEFVHSFGHVIDIDPNDDFPDMAELQSALLGEYNDEENVFNSCCQSLLYIALFDPGISGKYSKTSLGVDLKDIDLNESNISEVLRLFILSRSEGKQHTLSDQLSTKPLASLSPEDKSSALAFLCDELLCGKAIGREIEANLDTMSNLRREKWSLEGQLRKLKQDVLKKKPKLVKQQDENEDEENESEEEKESEDEEEPIEEGDTMEEDDNDGKMSDADGSLTQAEKELKKMEKKHAKFRSKLFKASQAVRGIYLGQDRFKRRYYILPNGGGIFVEGLESGYFNEGSSKTLLEQEESGNLTNEGKSDSNHCDIMKQKDLKPTSNENSTDTKVFSLFHSRKCDSNKRTTTRFSLDQFQVNNNKKVIISPNVHSLNNDTKFLKSVCTFYASANGPTENHTAVQSTEQGTISSYIKEEPSNSGESSLPFKLDLHKLMHEDRQKAVELLQQQSWHQKDIPSAMKHGWWKIYTKEQLDSIVKALHPRGTRERHFQKSINRIMEYAVASVKKDVDAFSLELSEEDNKDENKYIPQITPDGRIPDQWYPEVAYAVDKAVLIEVEELEEKVFSASLQTKGLRLPQKVSPSLNYKEIVIQDIKEEKNPIRIAAKRLLQLEEGIERRYLKHPFKKSESADQSKDDTLKNSNLQETTTALLLWRKVVNEVLSGAQLSICINMLNECIGWEKSIMKVFCILCRKSDNEERLLLCDACDRGCHTYCCKPKLENIPEGDWFCQECVLMASGSDQCYKCKAKSGKRLKCAHCPRHYHLQCLEPPLQKTPRSPWSCPVCKKLRAKSNPSISRNRPKPEDVNKKEDRIKTRLPNQTKLPKDMEICKDMLDELEAHKMAWPFLVAVNAKQFPEYYKVICRPMDFSTMRTKLLELQYQSNEEFARDARLVFKNCDIFNEDDSEIGRAGKTMLNFFEKRWRQLVTTNVCQNKTVQAINTLQEAPEEGDSYIETEEEEEEVEIEDSSEMETSSSDSENSDTNNESGENMQ